MDDKWGALIYLVILAIIGITGALRKKKSQAPGGTPPRQQEMPSVLEKLITGSGMADVLLQDETKTEVTAAEAVEEEEITEEPVKPEKTEYEKMIIPRGKGYNWDMDMNESLLSSEDEGEPVFRHKQWNKENGGMMETKEEREQEEMENGTFLEELIEDFDPRKAVIYSEILDRKYF